MSAHNYEETDEQCPDGYRFLIQLTDRYITEDEAKDMLVKMYGWKMKDAAVLLPGCVRLSRDSRVSIWIAEPYGFRVFVPVRFKV